MEKQETEMKWKLETEKQKWKRKLLAVVVNQMLLIFVPQHPSPLLASSCHRHPQLYCGHCLCSQQHSIFGVPYFYGK